VDQKEEREKEKQEQPKRFNNITAAARYNKR